MSNGVTAPCHHTEGLHKKAEKAAALPKQQRTGQAKNGEEKTKSCSTEADERLHMRNLLDYPEEPLFKILYAKNELSIFPLKNTMHWVHTPIYSQPP